MKYLLLIPLILLFSSCALISSKDEIHGTIIEYGIFKRGGDEDNIVCSPSIAGTKFVSSKWGRQIERTTNIKAELRTNTLFGYIFKIEGFKEDGEVDLIKTIIHPEMTKPGRRKSKGHSYIDPFFVENRKHLTFSEILI